jgi:hypothetical protein
MRGRRAILVGLAAVLALAACGDEGKESSAKRAAWLPEEVRSCLKSSGAMEATTVGDLAFYRKDRDREEVDRPGFFGHPRFIAEMYEPSFPSGVGQPYVVYVMQPWDRPRSGGGPDPIGALADPGGSAVWYVPAGTATRRTDVETCFDADDVAN